MDGLSSAASGIAVVSLAIQVVESVRKIQRFLRYVSEAPKELQRLLDLLEQLELILESIGTLMDKQNANGGIKDDSASPIVLRAMKSCQHKLSMLENVVEAAKKASEGTNRATRSLGFFRLACKKKDIEEFESHLQHAINILDLTMTMNLTSVRNQNMTALLDKIGDTISQELSSLRTNDPPSSNARQWGCSNTHYKLGHGNRNSQGWNNTNLYRHSSKSSRRYSTLLGSAIVQSTRRTVRFNDSFQESKTREIEWEENTWCFLPSFLSQCLELQFSNSFGKPSRVLRTYPVIPWDCQAFNMCIAGDIKGLQDLFARNIVSPFSVNSCGTSLLHLATLNFHLEVCDMLLYLGVNPCYSNEYGHDCNYFLFCNVQSPKNLGSFALVSDLFMPLFDNTEVEEILLSSPLGMLSDRFDKLEMLVNNWVTTNTINRFKYSLILHVLFHFENSSSEEKNDSDQRRKWIRKLISMGADIHQITGGQSLLHYILGLAGDPFESKELGDIWLDCLSYANIDVGQYLATEADLNFQSSFLQLNRVGEYLNIRNRIVIVSIEPSGVLWDWWTNPEGLALHVLEEFKYIAQEDLWPFEFPCLHLDWKCDESDWRARSEFLRKKLKLACERFERRYRNKEAKRIYGSRLRKISRIPGAWVY